MVSSMQFCNLHNSHAEFIRTKANETTHTLAKDAIHLLNFRIFTNVYLSSF